MNWFFKKAAPKTQEKRRSATVDSIRSKLADYTPSTGKSVFEGPSLVNMTGMFEYEKVAIDPDASGFHHVPFQC